MVRAAYKTNADTRIETDKGSTSAFERRRLQIIKAAAKLFIKQGYLKTSMREIAKRCDISVATLYHYVHSKDHILSLFNEVTLDRFVKFHDGISSDSRQLTATESLKLAIKEYLSLVDEIQDVDVFWYQETKNLNPNQRKALIQSDEMVASVFHRIIVRGYESGEFKTSDPLLIAHTLVVLGDMWAFRRWFLRKHYTFEQYLEDQTEFILSSILSHRTR